MTFVTRAGRMSVAQFGAQPCFIRNVNCPPPHHDQSVPMQAAKIPRDEFAYRSNATGEFLIVFHQFDFDSSPAAYPVVRGKTQQMSNQSISNGGKGKLLNQAPEVPQPVPEDADHLQR
jgi:hypothetical protein